MSISNNLLTIKQFCNAYPAFSIGGIRALIFNAEKNGFTNVIKRFSPTGKRGKILIDVTAFEEWFLSKQEDK